MRAVNLLRRNIHYRRECFSYGLKKAGFKLVDAIPDPKPGDVFLCWNRYGHIHAQATQFEKMGGTVLVAENCFFGNDYLGGRWYSLARSNVAMTSGDFRPGDFSRWFKMGCDLHPFNRLGSNLLVLGQRGIGPPGIASPSGWAESVRSRFGGRIRPHPGIRTDVVSLEKDLEGMRGVATWSSAAAVQALVLGYPVWYRHPGFMMASCSTDLAQYDKTPPNISEKSRLAAFERAAWAIWDLEEIRTGEPIARLL